METQQAETALQGIIHAIKSMVEEGRTEMFQEYLGLLADMRAFYQTYWGQRFDAPYTELLAVLSAPADLLLAAAFDADARQLPQAAAQLAEGARQLRPAASTTAVLASFLRKAGALSQAAELCQAIARQQPDSQQALSELFMCEVADKFWPRDYYDLLAELHRVCKPRVYLEIGVATGKSLALAQAWTWALGIDPVTADEAALVYHSLANRPQLYRITSDEFFSSRDVRREMGMNSFDLAFIDGLHHFDQVLRDFINVERFADPGSAILIHDCLPVDPRVATRDRSTAFWTGDVWKIIPCLKAVRPDLEIFTLPLAPAGLAVVRRLDPTSKVLNRHFPEIVEQFDRLTLPDSWSERCTLLAVQQDHSVFSIDQVAPEGGWA